MFSYSTGYYVSLPDDQYLKFKNRCSLIYTRLRARGVGFPIQATWEKASPSVNSVVGSNWQ